MPVDRNLKKEMEITVDQKLVMVIPTLRGGGAERVATTLVQAFSRLEPKLKLILVLFGKENDVALPASVTVRCLDVHLGESLPAALYRFFQAVSRLAAILRETGPCAVLSFLDFTNIVTLLANWLVGAGNRIAISVRTRPSAQYRQYPANYRERVVGSLIKHLYNRANIIISVSRDAADDLVKNFKVRNDLIQILHNPVDLHHITVLAGENVSEPVFQTSEPIVLAVGRLSPAKGFDSLLRAFALLRKKMPAKLVMVGDGPEKAPLMGLCRRLCLANDVLFLGHQENPYKFMQRATLFALTSRYEGFVNVVGEALACNLPVLGTRCFTDIEEIVKDGESGLLVSVDDIEGLAAGMLRLVNDAELRQRLAAAGKLQVQRLAVDTIAARYLAVLGMAATPDGMADVRN
jgi:glycosyltransferase involved in cell wall biosynthesis